MNLQELIKLAIEEDQGSGDHTSLACIPSNTNSRAQLLVKENGILAGLELAKQIFQTIDPDLKFKAQKTDGDIIHQGDIAFFVEGSVHSILLAERLVLNLMQRMSGIASTTFQIKKNLEGTHTRLLDTRKTTPLLRELEKRAVVIGGGNNHRFGLYDMILIKDNHVDYAGGITQALDACKKYLKEHNLNLPVEIETRNLVELKEALANGGFQRVMFDNYSFDDLRTAVKMVNHQYETEASGGITIENAREYALTGVDFISLGCLTHSVKSLDLSLKAC